MICHFFRQSKVRILPKVADQAKKAKSQNKDFNFDKYTQNSGLDKTIIPPKAQISSYPTPRNNLSSVKALNLQ